MHWSDVLTRMSACDGAVEWARTQPSYAVAWRRCQRPDWLLWLAGRCSRTLTQRRAIVLAACDCAETALRFVPAGEVRPAEAIRVARAWCRGRTTLEAVRVAADAAAYDAPNADAAAYAAYAAAVAVAAAAAVAVAAYDAADAATVAAAYAAVAAAAPYAAAAARATTREAASKCCGLIHARIQRPTLPKEATRCTGAMH
jgi:hypothetical protein